MLVLLSPIGMMVSPLTGATWRWTAGGGGGAATPPALPWPCVVAAVWASVFVFVFVFFFSCLLGMMLPFRGRPRPRLTTGASWPGAAAGCTLGGLPGPLVCFTHCCPVLEQWPQGHLLSHFSLDNRHVQHAERALTVLLEGGASTTAGPVLLLSDDAAITAVLLATGGGGITSELLPGGRERTRPSAISQTADKAAKASLKEPGTLIGL